MELQGLFIQPRASRDPRIAKTDLTRLSEGGDGILYKMLDPRDQEKYRILNEHEQDAELVKSKVIKEGMYILSGKFKDGQYVKEKTKGLRFVPPQFGTANHKNLVDKKAWESDLKTTAHGGTGTQFLRTKSAKYQKTILELAKNTQEYYEADHEEEKNSDNLRNRSPINELELVKGKYEQNLHVVEKLYKEKLAMERRIRALQNNEPYSGDELEGEEDDDEELPTLSQLDDLVADEGANDGNPGDANLYHQPRFLHHTFGGREHERPSSSPSRRFNLGASLQDDYDKYVKKRRLWEEQDKQAKREEAKRLRELETSKAEKLTKKDAQPFSGMAESEKKAQQKREAKKAEEELHKKLEADKIKAEREEHERQKQKLMSKALTGVSLEEMNAKKEEELKATKEALRAKPPREKTALELSKEKQDLVSKQRAEERAEKEKRDLEEIKEKEKRKFQELMNQKVKEARPTSAAKKREEMTKASLEKKHAEEEKHDELVRKTLPTKKTKPEGKGNKNKPTEHGEDVGLVHTSADECEAPDEPPSESETEEQKDGRSFKSVSRSVKAMARMRNQATNSRETHKAAEGMAANAIQMAFMAAAMGGGSRPTTANRNERKEKEDDEKEAQVEMMPHQLDESFLEDDEAGVGGNSKLNFREIGRGAAAANKLGTKVMTKKERHKAAEGAVAMSINSAFGAALANLEHASPAGGGGGVGLSPRLEPLAPLSSKNALPELAAPGVGSKMTFKVAAATAGLGKGGEARPLAPLGSLQSPLEAPLGSDSRNGKLKLQEVESAAMAANKLSSKAVGARGQLQQLSPIPPDENVPRPESGRPANLKALGHAAIAVNSKKIHGPEELSLDVEPPSIQSPVFQHDESEDAFGSDRESFAAEGSRSSARPASAKTRPARGGRKYHDNYADNQHKIAEAVKDTPSLIDRHDLKIATDHTQLKAINTVKNIVKASGVQEKDKLNDKLFH